MPYYSVFVLIVGTDMDYRMASDWRAWREQPGICEDTEQGPTSKFWDNDSDEVPFVF